MLIEPNSHRCRSLARVGAALVEALLAADYNVVATSRNVNQSLAIIANPVLVAGDIGKTRHGYQSRPQRRSRTSEVIDLLVTNGDLLDQAFHRFHSRRLQCPGVDESTWAFYITPQLAVGQMLKQQSGAVRQHHCCARRPTDRRRECGGSDDHQGRTERRDQEPGPSSMPGKGSRFNAVAPESSTRRCTRTIRKEFLRTLAADGKDGQRG